MRRILVAVSLCLCGLLPAGESPTVTRLWADSAAVDAAFWASAQLDPMVADGQALVLELTCADAFLGHPVVIEVVRFRETWWPGRAWCFGVTWAEHPSRVEAFAVEDGKVTATVTVDFEAGPGWTNDPLKAAALGDCRTLTGRLTFQGTLKGDAITGSSRWAVVPPVVDRNEKPPVLPDPFVRKDGACTGTWRTLTAGWVPGGGRKATPNWVETGSRKGYALGIYTERLALRSYHHLRALRIARRIGLPYPEVARRIDWWDPARPPLPGAGEAKQQPKPSDDGLGDLDTMLDAAFEEDLTPKEQQVFDAVLGRAANRVATLRYLAERAVTAADAAPVPLPDNDDPDFGPWGDAPPLPAKGTQAQVLPEEVGAPGATAWMQVSRWRVLTPCPPLPPGFVDPLLPDLVPEDGGQRGLRPEALIEGGNLKNQGPIGWRPLSARPGWGFTAPDNLSSANRVYRNCPRTLDGRHTGIEHSRSHFLAVVEAPRAVALWAAIGINQRGELWLGDRLLWAGPADFDETHVERVALVRIPFAGGANTLRVVCDVDYSSPSMWLRLCVRGGPRSADAVAERAAALAAIPPPAPRGWSGWRGDGTGIFPTATPPVAWDLRSGQNVRWHTPLPYWSNATPALASDRLFVTVEPQTLVCLAKDDGRILWQQPVSLMDCLDDGPRAEGWRLYEAWWTARTERDAIPESLLPRPKWLNTRSWWEDQDTATTVDERVGTSPALLALLDRRDTLEAEPDPESVQEELAKVLKQIDAEKEKNPPPEKAAALAVGQRERQAWRAWLTFMQKHCPMGDLQGYWYDYDGYAFASPITDGQHVWWKNGTGAVACFTMDGERLWLKRTDGAGSGSPTIPSPLLVDGTLILKLPDYEDGRNRTKRGRGVRLRALDPATGETLWDTRDLRTSGWNASTPAIVDLTDGATRMSVLVTGGGSVVRAADGRVLIDDLGLEVADASPLVADDVVFFSRPVAAAVKLVMIDRDTVLARRLFARRDATSYAGLFTADGLVYKEAGPFRGGLNERPCGVELLDGATGALLGVLPVFRKGGNCWQVHAATRDHVLFLGGDTKFNGSGPKPPADLAVITRGPDPVLIAHNAVERSYGSPVAEGDRLYLRGYRGVACIGYQDDAGRIYEARRVAATLLDQVPACPLAAVEPLTIPPRPGRGDKGGTPTWAVDCDGLAPSQWLFRGPMNPGEDREAVQHLITEAAQHPPLPGDDWHPLDWADAGRGSCPRHEIDPATCTLILGPRRTVPLDRLRIIEPDRTTLFAVDLYVERESTWRLDLDGVAGQAVLGGVTVPDGARVTLRPGRSLLLVAADGQAARLSPRLWRSDDVQAEIDRAQARWRKGSAWFDKVRELTPESAEATRVSLAAKALGRE